jgi:hypothetical protein
MRKFTWDGRRMIPLDSKGFETDSISRIVAWAMHPDDRPRHSNGDDWEESEADKTNVEYLPC